MDKPKSIFKYQSLTNYSLRNVKNNQIYFNNPQNFNDPFDTFQEVKIIGLSEVKMKDTFWGSLKERNTFELIERGDASSEDCENIYSLLSKCMSTFSFNLVIKLQPQWNKHIHASWQNIIELNSSHKVLQKLICKTFYETIDEIIKESMKLIKEKGAYGVGVSCFSEDNDNMLMWSHYGDGHKGFCLEFDTSYDPFTKMFPVSYSKEIPEIDMDQFLNGSADNLQGISANLLHKYIDWKYEKEWRIIHTDKTSSYCYKSNALIGVYFGNKISRTDLEIIATIIKGQHSKCKFYKMEKVPGTFRLIPRIKNYQTFSEAKSIVSNEITKDLNNGVKDINTLVEKLKIPSEQLKSILMALVDDLNSS